MLLAKDIFDHLYDNAAAVAESSPQHTVATSVLSALVNVRAITAHFSAKVRINPSPNFNPDLQVADWVAANAGSTITAAEVVAVVRDTYDALTLKLQVF